MLFCYTPSPEISLMFRTEYDSSHEDSPPGVQSGRRKATVRDARKGSRGYYPSLCAAIVEVHDGSPG